MRTLKIIIGRFGQKPMSSLIRISSTIHLGFQTQTLDRHERGIQVQGPTQPPRWIANAWSQILEGFLTGGELVLEFASASIMPLLSCWETRQIDFVLTFPQADVEYDLFMQLPCGRLINFLGFHRSTHCFKLKKNLYESCQAGRVSNQHLVDELVNTLNSNRARSTNTSSIEE